MAHEAIFFAFLGLARNFENVGVPANPAAVAIRVTTDAFADMLSELRKYGVGLVLANQHTTQLDAAVFEAMLGNVGTLVAFRVGATDATILSKQFGAEIPQPRDLVNLPNYELFVKLMIDGRQSKPFSALTLAPSLSVVSQTLQRDLRA